MSVNNGQKVDEAVTNAALMSRLNDTDTAGRIDLLNALAASGSNILNIQRLLNGLASFVGANTGGTFDQKPTWIDNSFGTSGDTTKARADALTTALKAVQDSVNVLPSWSGFQVNFGDISTAGLTFNLVLNTLDQKVMLHHLVFKVITEFGGGSISSLVVDLGTNGDPTRYIDDHDLLVAPASTDFETFNLGEIFDFGDSENIELNFTAVGDNLDQLAQGQLEVFMFTSQLPTL